MAKTNKTKPEQINITQREADELMSRVKNHQTTEDDAKILASVLTMVIWMQQQLSHAKLTIKRLKKFFGFKSELSKKSKDSEKNDIVAQEDLTGTSSDKAPNANPPLVTDKSASNLDEKNTVVDFDPKQNHGRLSAADYTGCDVVDVPLDETFSDGNCPKCNDLDTEAKLQEWTPRNVVVLKSTPLVSGTKYQLERVRCQVCLSYFKASMPDGEDDEKDRVIDATCVTSISINHYYAGLPFKRIETLQKLQGVPLPDSTQYDLMRQLYESVISQIVLALRQCAANGNSFYLDDTPGRIIEQMPLDKKGKKRSVHTTALLSTYDNHRIYLFDTNTKTAGKELKELFSERTDDSVFMTMSDASSSNFAGLEESLLVKWIICLCLAHGRRRFVELLPDEEKEANDHDIDFVLDIIGRVYDNDRCCKREKMGPDKRLIYHKKYSTPLMDALQIWFSTLMQYRMVEPNSQLGRAIKYMLKHWHGLTQFLRIPGAPLDNNLCEQAIKVAIRYRKNSLFYRSLYGASVGDAIMSVLHTAAANEINLFDYMNALQANVELVNANPHNWLPWRYQQTLQDINDDYLNEAA